MLRGENAVLGYLSLSESLKALRCLQDDVVLIDLPQAVSFRLDTDHQEVDWDVWLLGHLLVLLHKTQNKVCLLGHRDSKLRIVEPSIIGIILNGGVLVLLIWSGLNWIWSTCGVSSPLAMD